MISVYLCCRWRAGLKETFAVFVATSTAFLKTISEAPTEAFTQTDPHSLRRGSKEEEEEVKEEEGQEEEEKEEEGEEEEKEEEDVVMVSAASEADVVAVEMTVAVPVALIVLE